MHRIIYLLLFPTLLMGQNSTQDIIERKIKYAYSQLNVSDENEFIIATPYVKNYVGFTGTPFWVSDIWNSANVLYNGKLHNVPELKYDCANDLMIVTNYTPEGVKLLNLIPAFYPEIFINRKIYTNRQNKLISESQIKQEHFIYYIASNDEKEKGTPTGYYHYLTESKVSILCKYTSTIVDRDGQKTFMEGKKYYFMNDKKIYLIRRIENIIDVFPQWKDKTTSFVMENNIKANISDLDDIIRLIGFINTLSAQ